MGSLNQNGYLIIHTFIHEVYMQSIFLDVNEPTAKSETCYIHFHFFNLYIYSTRSLKYWALYPHGTQHNLGAQLICVE